ncbi:MAG: putative toxin-antitoxin system toxin component, PIN family [Chthoniobacteraceae bacterium]
MTVVIDTNVVLGMFNPGHRTRPIFSAWLDGHLQWAVSTEILLEYEEIVGEHSGSVRVRKTFELMEIVSQQYGNVLHISPSFRFRLIAADADDDKFADCAIAADADCIISGDHHFDVLLGSGYKPQPIAPEEFIRRHLGGG